VLGRRPNTTRARSARTSLLLAFRVSSNDASTWPCCAVKARGAGAVWIVTPSLLQRCVQHAQTSASSVGQYVVQCLDQRHVHAEARHHKRKLTADGATAENEQALGQGVQRRGCRWMTAPGLHRTRSPGFPAAGSRWRPGYGAFRAPMSAVHGDLVRARDLRRALYVFHFVTFEQARATPPVKVATTSRDFFLHRGVVQGAAINRHARWIPCPSARQSPSAW
jgi:hypothetical protein